jgi:hypothetical protein
MFMTNVLIPLAAQTQAVVLCDAVPSESVLSASFLRMYAVLKAKWSGPTPFTVLLSFRSVFSSRRFLTLEFIVHQVLSLTNAIHNFYLNPDEDAHWKQIRRTSRAWRQRDAKLFELFGPSSDDPERNMEQQYDLDMNASIIILTDNIDSKRDKLDLHPFGALKVCTSCVSSYKLQGGLSFNLFVHSLRYFSSARACPPPQHRGAFPCYQNRLL